jgi:hypothetical protein
MDKFYCADLLKPWKYLTRKSLWAGTCPPAPSLYPSSASTPDTLLSIGGGIGLINTFPYCYKLEIKSVTVGRINVMNRLTLRPQFPKSCREFATTSIPSHIIVSISISSYSSVTVGRKKTSLPRGLSIAREKRTRSETSSESSYGFVGGIYG